MKDIGGNTTHYRYIFQWRGHVSQISLSLYQASLRQYYLLPRLECIKVAPYIVHREYCVDFTATTSYPSQPDVCLKLTRAYSVCISPPCCNTLCLVNISVIQYTATCWLINAQSHCSDFDTFHIDVQQTTHDLSPPTLRDHHHFHVCSRGAKQAAGIICTDHNYILSYTQPGRITSSNDEA